MELFLPDPPFARLDSGRLLPENSRETTERLNKRETSFHRLDTRQEPERPEREERDLSYEDTSV